MIDHPERTVAEAPDPPDASDLDALAASTTPVAAWDVTDEEDASVDLAALTASTSSAPPEANTTDASLDLAVLAHEAHPPVVDVPDSATRAPAHVEGLGRWRLLGAVVGLALGSAFGALVLGVDFGTTDEVRPPAPTPSAGPVAATVQQPAPQVTAPPAIPTPAPPAAPTPEPEPLAPTAAVVPTEPAPTPPAAPDPTAPPMPTARARTAPPRPATPVEPSQPPVIARAPETARPSVTLPAPPPEPAPAPSPTGDIDALLDQAITPTAQGNVPAKAAEPAADEPLPHLPSRDEVQELIASLRPAIRLCAMGDSGFGHADVVVRNDGSVAGVHVTGAPFAGAPSGKCMESVIRPARFPRFEKSQFHFRFPIAIP